MKINQPIDLLKEEIFYETVSRMNIDKKSRVLDIGCANIRGYSRYLIDNFGIYVGIDNSKDFVELAKRATLINKNGIIFQQNAEKINFSDNTFDLIVFNDMLAYTDKEKVISEIYRILKEDGCAISFFNNTLDYYVYKIFKPSKYHLKEILHSLMVILNTKLYGIINKKMHRTTYSDSDEIKKLVYSTNYENIKLIDIRDDFPYKTLNFIIRKSNV